MARGARPWPVTIQSQAGQSSHKSGRRNLTTKTPSHKEESFSATILHLPVLFGGLLPLWQDFLSGPLPREETAVGERSPVRTDLVYLKAWRFKMPANRVARIAVPREPCIRPPICYCSGPCHGREEGDDEDRPCGAPLARVRGSRVFNLRGVRLPGMVVGFFSDEEIPLNAYSCCAVSRWCFFNPVDRYSTLSREAK